MQNAQYQITSAAGLSWRLARFWGGDGARFWGSCVQNKANFGWGCSDGKHVWLQGLKGEGRGRDGVENKAKQSQFKANVRETGATLVGAIHRDCPIYRVGYERTAAGAWKGRHGGLPLQGAGSDGWTVVWRVAMAKGKL